MQESDGSMRLLTQEETTPKIMSNPRVVNEGRYFKIKHCYFKITKITPEGIEAKGVARQEYFENR